MTALVFFEPGSEFFGYRTPSKRPLQAYPLGKNKPWLNRRGSNTGRTHLSEDMDHLRSVVTLQLPHRRILPDTIHSDMSSSKCRAEVRHGDAWESQYSISLAPSVLLG